MNLTTSHPTWRWFANSLGQASSTRRDKGTTTLNGGMTIATRVPLLVRCFNRFPVGTTGHRHTACWCLASLTDLSSNSLAPTTDLPSEAFISMASIERLTFYSAAAFVFFTAAMPLLPVGSWTIRLFDFPRLQLLVLTLVLAVGVFARSDIFNGRVEAPLLAVVFVGVAVWQAARVIPYTPFWLPEVQATATQGGAAQGEAISICVANLDYSNGQQEAVTEQLLGCDADLLVIIEVNEAWSEALDPLQTKYPHHEGVVLPDGHGLALYSQRPFESSEVRYLVTDNRPSIDATFLGPDGDTVRIIAVHPTPPGLRDPDEGDRFDSRLRDAELLLVAKEVADDPDNNWIVTGDFNDVAWSHTTRLFRRISGLRDPRIGRGLYNTYHAGVPLLRFPIDHIFVSDQARLLKLGRFRPQGSDHFAITASFTFPAEAAARPRPENDDHEEANDLIDEGKSDAAERDATAE